MSELSSHILDAVNGKSAIGIRIQLLRLVSDSEKETVFDVMSDEQGRIAETVAFLQEGAEQQFEMVVDATTYFADNHQIDDSVQHLKQVVIRFSMTERPKRYHIPIVLSPHSYTVWWSE